MTDCLEIITPTGLRKVGPGQEVFIVAEMSGNHNQSLECAKQIIEAAAEAGVDAIKLQTYTPDTLTIDCDKDYFKVKTNNSWKGETLYSLYQKAFTPWEWQAELKAYGEAKGLIVFSTPFDETAVDFLEELKVPLYKVASFEIGDLELLAKIGQTKKPVIISRGLASVEEINEAINTLKDNGAPTVAILHCISAYPANPEQMNLATIPDLKQKFNEIVGLSDHGLGLVASLTSIALGATIIEKHFTLNRADGGPDAAFSLEPQEMKELVTAIRQATKAIGSPTYEIGKIEEENLVFKRSIFTIAKIEKGEKLTRQNIRCIRPGYGLAPKHLNKVLDMEAVCQIDRGVPLDWKLLK